MSRTSTSGRVMSTVRGFEVLTIMSMAIAGLSCPLARASTEFFGGYYQFGPAMDVPGATQVDGSGSRVIIDRDFLALEAGSYIVSDWRLQWASGANGLYARPFLATGTFNDYSLIWVGPRFTVTATSYSTVGYRPYDAETDTYTNTQTFSLASNANVFGGFFQNGPVVKYASGGSSDQGVGLSEPTSAGQTYQNLTSTNLGRSYAFEINILRGDPLPVTVTYSGSAQVLTLTSGTSVTSIQITSSGYTFLGSGSNGFNFYADNREITLGSGVSATIDAPINSPSAGLSLTGTGSRGTLQLGGAVTVGGTTNVNGLLLNVSGSITTLSLLLDAASKLGGTGQVNGVVAGAGSVAPGNSPGILTATQVDPTGGLDFAFEFGGTAPNYASGTSSVNDVLRLTGSTPFTAALTTVNTKTLFLNFTKEALTFGTGTATTLKGGFYTDVNTDFTSFLNNQIWDNGGFQVYVLGDGLGTDNSYNGQGYYNWRNPAMFGWNQSLFLSTTAETANFVGGSVDGRVMTLVVGVPEPSTYAMGLAGAGFLGLMQWSRRRRTAG